ncbi:response regulator [candidate division KSB1 bacterium]|nr:response regulator [candidate division KSB1 bacterium]NIR68625.1 response regulator [candidate division KSB1 bacterium]NIS25495.1 response regulator [candidate division KSB1 bacterium]NIT72386.1 response regulator [candidate division KSB1 bacterium]NIU26174.1 response regulator [candidate division KSB1 bacterium]
MKGNILIACRDNECRIHLLRMLSKPTVTVDSVTEDEDVLLQMLEKDYDALIVDLDMLSFDGLKMVKILRRMRPKVPLVVISNDPSKELGGKILQEGVIYYAVKPVHLEAVKQAVLNCLA